MALIRWVIPRNTDRSTADWSFLLVLFFYLASNGVFVSLAKLRGESTHNVQKKPNV
jgi:hypothetical protein